MARKRGVPVAFENEFGMRFVLIPAGTFLMGSPESEEGRGGDETQHEVTITRPFYMQTTEVTNGQYRRLQRGKRAHDSGMYNHLTLNGDRQPVVGLEPSSILSYAETLSLDDKKRTYRLPTEAEWEWACRAGSKGAYWWGPSEEDAGLYANIADRAFDVVRDWGGERVNMIIDTEDGHGVTAPVASYAPSAWRLWDMIGNVWEMCADRYADYPTGKVKDPRALTGGPYVVRGGSWATGRGGVRCATRWRFGGSHQRVGTDHDGFRLASPLSE